MKNKIIGLLLTCVLALAMCMPVFGEEITEYDGVGIENFQTFSEDFHKSLLLSTEEELESAAKECEDTLPDLSQGYRNFNSLRDQLQGSEATGSVLETVEEGQGAVVLKTTYNGENGEYLQTITLDEDLSVLGFSYESTEKADMGQLMAKAGMNTLIGMAIVFLVLILISFVISLLKYLPGSGARKKEQKKTEAVNDAPVPAVPAAAANITGPAAQPTDDTELIAVISAAVAAAMGTTTTDGFVVRSIKKRKW